MESVFLLLRLAGSASPSLFTTGWVAIGWVGNGCGRLCFINRGWFGGWFLATTANQVGRHRERCGHCNNIFFHFL